MAAAAAAADVPCLSEQIAILGDSLSVSQLVSHFQIFLID